MSANIISMAISWGILTLVVVALAIYKRSLDGHIDEGIHFNTAEEAALRRQAAETHRSEVVERWGKALTAVVVLYGLVILGMLIYQQWNAAATMGFK
jgi:hypothetical protein